MFLKASVFEKYLASYKKRCKIKTGLFSEQGNMTLWYDQKFMNSASQQ